MTTTTRFAPSPTGHLHLGHAFSALFAAQSARDSGGRFLLRIEDIDPGRCRPEFDTAIMEDLGWLGLKWETPVRRQSEHMDDYATALEALDAKGLLYACFCTRSEIRREIEAAGHAPHAPPHGPDGPLYPGICRGMGSAERADRMADGDAYVLRLDMAAAVACAGPLNWYDRDKGIQVGQPKIFGDVVLARKDTPTSYHLAVTVDDHLQDVSLITRGEDLFSASHIHRLLQALLGYETPDYFHHALLTDDDGKRFSKRDKAKTLREMRDSGTSAEQIRRNFGMVS